MAENCLTILPNNQIGKKYPRIHVHIVHCYIVYYIIKFYSREITGEIAVKARKVFLAIRMKYRYV